MHGASPDSNAAASVAGAPTAFPIFSHPTAPPPLPLQVHNLFDEYRYFPKYPDKPLRTTALLFGALVQHGLVANITLGMFLR